MKLWSNWLRAWRRSHDSKDAADREVEHSSRRLAETRDLMRPLADIHERNQFSDMIRDALVAGYGPPHREGKP